MRRISTLLVIVASAFLAACGSPQNHRPSGAFFAPIVSESPPVPARQVDISAAPDSGGNVFRWKHPGGDRNKETVAQSIERFADKVPADVRQLLLQQYQTGRAIATTSLYEGAVTVGEIYPGMKTVRMTFGHGTVVPNVFVDPRDFASPQWQRASKKVMMYQITKKTAGRFDTYYALVFEECDNVALIILDSQGDCIKDTLLCDADCQKIKAVVPQRVSWGLIPRLFFEGRFL